MTTKIKKDPVILFRKDRDTEEEYDICKKYFSVYDSRSKVPKDSLVIGRYSCLPFYKELEEDLNYNNSNLINTYRQHRYIADLSNWYLDFSDITPQTYFRLEDVPKSGGPFILKGETNSKKYHWKEMMYAENFQEAGKVYSNLQKDSLIGSQNIYIRDYVPLVTFEHDFSGLPITEEYRFFFYKGKVLSGGFYWSSHSELIENKSLNINPKNVPQEMLQDIANRIGKNSNFYVVDIARTIEPYNSLYNQFGNFIVIEVNDATMSGISENKSEILYSNLKKCLESNDLNNLELVW